MVEREISNLSVGVRFSLPAQMTELSIKLLIIGLIFILTPYKLLLHVGNAINKVTLSTKIGQRLGTAKIPHNRLLTIRIIGLIILLSSIFFIK